VAKMLGPPDDEPPAVQTAALSQEMEVKGPGVGAYVVSVCQDPSAPEVAAGDKPGPVALATSTSTVPPVSTAIAKRVAAANAPRTSLRRFRNPNAERAESRADMAPPPDPRCRNPGG
jgi:hypothetical protein